MSFTEYRRPPMSMPYWDRKHKHPTSAPHRSGPRFAGQVASALGRRAAEKLGRVAPFLYNIEAMNLRFIPQLALTLAGLLALSAAAHASKRNLETATIADLQTAFADGSLSSQQLVRAYMARIDAYDKKGPTINTVITFNAHVRGTHAVHNIIVSIPSYCPRLFRGNHVSGAHT
jgi:hypothetical protein